MKLLTLNDGQVAILRDLLDFNIENLIDEPEDSYRGQQCRDSQAIFDQLYSKDSSVIQLEAEEVALLDILLDLHIENMQEYDLAGVDKDKAEDLKVAEAVWAKVKATK